MAESQGSLRVLIPLITDKNVYLSLVQPFGHSIVFHLTFILGEFFFSVKSWYPIKNAEESSVRKLSDWNGSNDTQIFWAGINWKSFLNTLESRLLKF